MFPFPGREVAAFCAGLSASNRSGAYGEAIVTA